MTRTDPVCWCEGCGEELPRGTLAYFLEGRWYCRACLSDYARDFFGATLVPVE